MTSGRVEIGRLGKPHGLTGEIKVHLHWTESESLFDIERVLLVADGVERSMAVQSARPGGKQVLLKLAGVDDRDAAQALTGSLLLVERADLPPLDPGEYYLADLVGARVQGPEGPLGVVTEIRNHPTMDCLVIRLTDGRIAEQPISEDWVERVDVEAGEVELSSTDALIV